MDQELRATELGVDDMGMMKIVSLLWLLRSDSGLWQRMGWR